MARSIGAWTSRQRVKNAVIFHLARWAMWLLGRVPLAIAKSCGAFVGHLGWCVAASERRQTLANIAVAYPSMNDAERRLLGLSCFRSLGRRAAEICWLDRLDLTRYVRLQHRERCSIEAALAQGRGLIWVTAHFGNWELLAAGLSAHGFDVCPVATPSYDPRFTTLVDSWRRRHGVRTMWRGRDDIGDGVARALHEGAIVGLLIDQDTDVRGCFVPFFGKLAWTPSGAAELARQTGAPLLVGFAHPTDDGGHEIRVVEPELSRGAEVADDEGTTAVLTRAIEAAVRDQPEEWVWMHRRWRRRPPGGEGSGR